MKRWAPLVAALVVGALAGTTIAVRAGNNDVLEKAAEATAKQTSYRVEFTSGTANIEFGTQMLGIIDQRSGLGRFTMRLSAPVKVAHPAGCTLITSADTVYVPIAAAKRSAYGGKAWVASDITGFLPLQQIGQGKFSGGSFENVHDLKQIETGAVRGIAATHYRATADVGKIAPQLRATLGSSVPRTVPIDIWISDDNLVRRYETSFTLKNGTTSVRTTSRFDFFDFGVPANIAPPPPAQVSRGDAQRALSACITQR